MIGSEHSVMAPAPLRCWSCDHDLAAPPFRRWQQRLEAGAASAETVSCGVCGRRYRVEWTASGWQITDAIRPSGSSRTRG
jgi:uncharacterized protein CbrC (UPF0167 family)